MATRTAPARRAASEAKPPTTKPKPGPLDALTAEQKKFITEVTMTYPGGCTRGKREFIKKLGLPTPPETVTLGRCIVVEVKPGEVSTSYGTKYLNKKGYDRIKREWDKASASIPGFNIKFPMWASQTHQIDQ